MRSVNAMSGLAITIVASIVMLLMAIVYFMITVWTIKLGAQWSGFNNVEDNIIVLGACIVTAATMVGSALKK